MTGAARSSLFQLRFARRPVRDYLPPMLVVHLLPFLAFGPGPQAADAKAGFAIELADVDTG
jgi:hypothetical protein